MPVSFIPDTMRQGRHLKGRWGVAQTGQISKHGTVEQWEHWDDSVDATVRLKATRIRMRPEHMNRPAVQKLMLEFEQAIRLNEAAIRSGDERVHQRTAMAVTAVRDRLWEELG